VAAERFEPTDSTRVRRLPGRSAYERETIYAILDEAPYCHVGIADTAGPVVIPMLHARVGDRVLLHGSPASRLFRAAATAERICVTVTRFDGLVLARSVFHHSANYRSAVVFGPAVRIDDPTDKRKALRAFTEKLIPGRWEDARQPTAQEMRATAVVAVEIEEASAKIRTGPPEDAASDLGLDVWAGVIPYRLQPGPPISDPADGVAIPPYLLDLIRG